MILNYKYLIFSLNTALNLRTVLDEPEALNNFKYLAVVIVPSGLDSTRQYLPESDVLRESAESIW